MKRGREVVAVIEELVTAFAITAIVGPVKPPGMVRARWDGRRAEDIGDFMAPVDVEALTAGDVLQVGDSLRQFFRR